MRRLALLAGLAIAAFSGCGPDTSWIQGRWEYTYLNDTTTMTISDTEIVTESNGVTSAGRYEVTQAKDGEVSLVWYPEDDANGPYEHRCIRQSDGTMATGQLTWKRIE